MHRHLIYLIILLLVTTQWCLAQSTKMIDEKISHQKVKEIGENVNISRTKKIWKKREVQRNTGSSGEGDGEEVVLVEESEPRSVTYRSRGSLDSFFQIIKYILLILLLGVVAYLIIYALQYVQDESDKKVDIEDIIQEEIIEEDLNEMDLDSLLQQALSESNYKHAIRIKFLMLLKELSEEETINWSKEKTNKDYLRELRTHDNVDILRNIFLQYEVAWYGDDQPTLHDFEQFNIIVDDISNQIPTIALG